MTAALPFSGGTATFATAAFGSAVGMFTGMAYTIEFTIDASAYIVGACHNLNQAIGVDNSSYFAGLWWLIIVVFVFSVLSWGLKPTFNILLIISVSAVLFLIVFAALMIPHIDFHKYVLDQPRPLFTMGAKGVFLSLPYCVWWFIGVEIIPCCAEETRDTRRRTPIAAFASTGTINAMVILVMFINSAVAPGIIALADTANPLQAAMISVFGWSPTGIGASLMAAVPALPLISGALAAIYAASRHLYSLSRGGYLPEILSLTNSRTRTPIIATAMVTIMAGGLAVMGQYVKFPGDESGAGSKSFESVLIESAVAFAYIGYTADMVVFIKLRYTMATLPRPYKAPLGILSALTVIVISMTGLVTGIWTTNLYWITACIVLGLIVVLSPYYLKVVRKRMVLTPEKAFIRQHLDYLFRDSMPGRHDNTWELKERAAAADKGEKGSKPTGDGAGLRVSTTEKGAGIRGFGGGGLEKFGTNSINSQAASMSGLGTNNGGLTPAPAKGRQSDARPRLSYHAHSASRSGQNSTDNPSGQQVPQPIVRFRPPPGDLQFTSTSSRSLDGTTVVNSDQHAAMPALPSPAQSTMPTHPPFPPAIPINPAQPSHAEGIPSSTLPRRYSLTSHTSTLSHAPTLPSYHTNVTSHTYSHTAASSTPVQRPREPSSPLMAMPPVNAYASRHVQNSQEPQQTLPDPHYALSYALSVKQAPSVDVSARRDGFDNGAAGSQVGMGDESGGGQWRAPTGW
ncbi:hypothetical protein HDV00_005415 [Rhizophlyctis rosea]|nr:hypothetical protein HDV00_005415 [Rhizophlyctis rosea]